VDRSSCLLGGGTSDARVRPGGEARRETPSDGSGDEASLVRAFVSYLNFGINPEETSWGNALSNAQNALILGNWWWAFFPGMAIAISVIAINFVGDGLRDALDPHARL
jgi:hypothetical protein